MLYAEAHPVARRVCQRWGRQSGTLKRVPCGRICLMLPAEFLRSRAHPNDCAHFSNLREPRVLPTTCPSRRARPRGGESRRVSRDTLIAERRVSWNNGDVNDRRAGSGSRRCVRRETRQRTRPRKRPCASATTCLSAPAESLDPIPLLGTRANIERTRGCATDEEF